MGGGEPRRLPQTGAARGGDGCGYGGCYGRGGGGGAVKPRSVARGATEVAATVTHARPAFALRPHSTPAAGSKSDHPHRSSQPPAPEHAVDTAPASCPTHSHPQHHRNTSAHPGVCARAAAALTRTREHGVVVHRLLHRNTTTRLAPVCHPYHQGSTRWGLPWAALTRTRGCRPPPAAVRCRRGCA